MIIGVITIDSCTINAVFDPEVLFNASIQKVLLATETKLINEHIITAFLLIFFSVFLKKVKTTIRQRNEQINKMENGGKKPNSIFDQM
jgi:hypothetical protein